MEKYLSHSEFKIRSLEAFGMMDRMEATRQNWKRIRIDRSFVRWKENI